MDHACPRSWALEDCERWPHAQPWMDSISQAGPGPLGLGRSEQQLPQRSGQAAWGPGVGPTTQDDVAGLQISSSMNLGQSLPSLGLDLLGHKRQ